MSHGFPCPPAPRLLRALVGFTLATLGASVSAAQAAIGPQNVLLVVIDDVGTSELSMYGLGSDFPSTPNIDSLAAQGVTFLRAWGYPTCSPTRATLLTGRYGFRTSIGSNVSLGHATDAGFDPPELSLGENLLPEVMDLGTGGAVAHGFFGKWHLGNDDSGRGFSPNLAGFGKTDVRMGNIQTPQESYYQWLNFEDGVKSIQQGYMTTHTVDTALAWLGTVQEPWFCTVSFNNAHSPFHAPPDPLHTVDLSAVEPGDNRPFYKAQVEAVDTELGRLLGSIGEDLSRTTVIVVGDNGASGQVIAPPFLSSKAKGTLYEGGIHAPLVIWAPWIAQPGRTEDALVATVDLFSTVLDLIPTTPGSVQQPPGGGIQLDLDLGKVVDGVSLLPYLLAAGAPPQREHVFSEWFYGADATHAIRDVRYKLVRNTLEGVVTEELYDLAFDPLELTNLLEGTLDPNQQAAYEALQAELQDLLAS